MSRGQSGRNSISTGSDQRRGIERPEAADTSGLWLLALVPRIFVRTACREECLRVSGVSPSPASCGSSRSSRRACRSSGGTGHAPRCRSSSAAVAAGAAGVAVARRVAGAAGLAGGLAGGSVSGATTRLGEATLGVEILLGCGEHELLSAIRTRQGLIAVQKNSSRFDRPRSPLGSRVSRERSPVSRLVVDYSPSQPCCDIGRSGG
jgi:hypothetical protein